MSTRPHVDHPLDVEQDVSCITPPFASHHSRRVDDAPRYRTLDCSDSGGHPVYRSLSATLAEAADNSHDGDSDEDPGMLPLEEQAEYDAYHRRRTALLPSAQVLSDEEESLSEDDSGADSSGENSSADDGSAEDGSTEDAPSQGDGAQAASSAGMPSTSALVASLASAVGSAGMKRGRPPATPTPTDVDAIKCMICLSNKSNVAFYPCSCMVNCSDCADKWARRKRSPKSSAFPCTYCTRPVRLVLPVNLQAYEWQ